MIAALSMTLALASGAPITLQVTAEPAFEGVPRIGINLGERSAWGAEQLAANVLANPGFEGVIDRAIVIAAAKAPAQGFADDAPALARPDGFWIGARYEILTGAYAGQSGTIQDSRAKGASGLAEFYPRHVDPRPEPGDALALTLVSDRAALAKWHVPDDARGRVTTSAASLPPGSLGARVLVLRPGRGAPARVHAFLDAIGARAGSLLPIDGAWSVSLWARAEGPGATLAITLRRHGAGAPILTAEHTLTTQWQRLEIERSLHDPGGAGILEFVIEAKGAANTVFVDDVDLSAREDDGRAFRRAVEKALVAVRPGYLRDWQGQLGDTFANRVAVPFARRVTRYGPGDDATHATYAIPEFLALARAVGARPWLVAPTTFGVEEWSALGEVLARDARDFDEVLVEIGNENWNALFRGAGVPKAATYAALSARAEQALSRGAKAGARIRMVAGLPPREGAEWDLIARGAPGVPILAVAPYYARSLARGLNDEARLARLFAPEAPDLAALGARARRLGRELAIYEVNAHTQGGDAPASERDGLVAGAASGAALARRLIEGLDAGATRQCVYALAGFDAFIGAGPETTRLFGVARDLRDEVRLRPSGLALALVNRALPGDVHRIEPAKALGDAGLRAIAVRDHAGWRALIASSIAQAREVEFVFPVRRGVSLPVKAMVLDGSRPFATNEGARDVRVHEAPLAIAGARVRVTVPPYAVVALTPASETAP